MDYESLAELSFYETVATLNPEHNISLVQHRETKKVYVKKVLSVYNKAVYQQLFENPISGIPKIVLLLEEQGQLTIIEEYISGKTVEELLDSEGAFYTDSVIRYMNELCTILQALHNLPTPVIHRDIKPSNVMITPDDKVVLLDMNAARADITKSEDTTLLGTKGYAAPEQYGFGSSDARTDIYALGMLMNTMLSGAFDPKPFEGSLLTPVIKKCLELNPNDRYKSAKKLKNALNNLPPVPVAPSDEKKFYCRYLLPGFRHLNPITIIFAAVYYIFFALVAFNMQVENTSGAALWFERIMVLLMIYSIPMCICNYLGIQKVFPLCKHSNTYVAFLGKLLFSVFTFVALFLVTIFLELVLFSS